MAIKEVKLQLRKIISGDEILMYGEPGFKEHIFKIGDGVLPWANLPIAYQQKFNISNGIGSGSLVQIVHRTSIAPSATGINAVAFGGGTSATGGSIAAGNSSLAAGSGAKTYENSCVAFGMAIAGRTAKEWAEYYWDTENWSPPSGKQRIPNGTVLELVDKDVPSNWAELDIVYNKNNGKYYRVRRGTTSYGPSVLNTSLAAGQNAKAKGFCSVAFGYDSLSYADYAVVTGQSTKSNAHHGYGGGYSSSNNSPYGFVHGFYLQSSSSKSCQVIFGKYNKLNDQALFQIGNGTQSTDRKNAFEVYENGIKIGSTSLTEEQLKELLSLI